MSNNDLISREALKEAIRKRLCISSLKYLTEQEKVIVEEIDNALKVERPQGEWLWLCDAPNAKYKWSCNKCGRGVKEQENYCPNCGVQMKGGAENDRY